MRRRQFRTRAVVDSPWPIRKRWPIRKKSWICGPVRRFASEMFSAPDERDALDNLPFMQEMLSYCGGPSRDQAR
jgi:hypothetical protein